jgi:hypothetical protein
MHQRTRFNRSLFWPARKLRPHFRAALAAGRADEIRFDVGELDTIGPAVRGDRDVMAAFVVAAIDQSAPISRSSSAKLQPRVQALR